MIKRIFIFTLALLCVICLFCSCNKEEESGEPQTIYYTVTFDSKGGSPVDSMRVKAGDMITQPEEPTKEGYIFNGWIIDGKTWLFSMDKVNSDITLSASWIDATTVFEYKVVSEEIVITGYTGNSPRILVPSVIAGMPVTTIGAEAFSALDYENIKQVILPESVVKVEASAFYECKLSSVIFEGKLTYIGEKAFYACDGLEKIELASGVQTIPYEAFKDCSSLTSIVLSDTVTLIDENAFDGCTSLLTITVHSSLKNVNDSAFVNCDSLSAIYYYGTAQNWESTNTSSGNYALDEAEFYIYSETEPPENAEGRYWHFERNGSIRIW